MNVILNILCITIILLGNYLTDKLYNFQTKDKI